MPSTFLCFLTLVAFFIPFGQRIYSFFSALDFNYFQLFWLLISRNSNRNKHSTSIRTLSFKVFKFNPLKFWFWFIFKVNLHPNTQTKWKRALCRSCVTDQSLLYHLFTVRLDFIDMVCGVEQTERKRIDLSLFALFFNEICVRYDACRAEKWLVF